MGMKQRDLELLAKYENDLITTLNLTYLLPHLTKCRLFTSNEAELLTKSELTRQDAIMKFLSILKTKGQTAFSLFVSALGNEREHLGHASLYKELTCEVHVQKSSLADNEPHPLPTASIRRSTSAHTDLCSDSGISQDSSSATSSAASVESVALKVVKHQLDFMKDQMDEHSRNISALTKRMDEVLHTPSSAMRTSSSLPTIARRKSLSKVNLDSSLNEQLTSTFSETSSRQGANFKRPRLTRSTTCSFPIIKDPPPKNSKIYYLSSKRIPEVDELILESVECSTIPSNLLILPPIIKDNEVYFISFNKSSPGESATNYKDTLHSFGLQSRQWKNTDIATVSHQTNQAVFPLLYKDDIAIIRLSLTETHDQSAKVGIYKLKEMSLWNLIAFTSDTLRPIELKNCQCAQSTRYIVLVFISQSTITFHLCKQSSQSWSTITFPLPHNKISSELQSCAIAHHTVFCSVMSTERNHQQKVTIYKLKLEHVMEKDKPQNNSNLEVVYNYDLNVLQCRLFVAGGEIMMMRVIVNNGDNRSSTLELCSLNDTLLNLKRQNKEYAFVVKLLSTIPLHTNTCNNHVLIVYYDSRFCKTHLEIFSLPSPTRN